MLTGSDLIFVYPNYRYRGYENTPLKIAHPIHFRRFSQKTNRTPKFSGLSRRRREHFGDFISDFPNKTQEKKTSSKKTSTKDVKDVDYEVVEDDKGK